MKSRHARKEATQARILDVARLHFERHGFDAASIRAIAAASGVATGTVLLHFTDKTGLLHAALYEDLEAAIARCLVAKTRGSLLARTSAIAGHFYAYYAARPKLSRTLLRESLFAEEPWRARFNHQVLRVTTHVALLAEQAKARGELAPTTDAGLLSVAFAAFYYLALLGWVQGGVDDPLALFKTLMAQHLGQV
jgi:AcrR family transcriptional regulator